MKIYSVLLTIVFSLTTNIFSQVQFTPHTITTNADNAASVYAVDVDGDGDMDVLSASEIDDKVAWYENDGNENFTPHTITTGADGSTSVYAADVDDDGDMDVLSAAYWDNKIAWYENDGSENFTSHTITTSAYGAVEVYAVDVDGDGDMDVLSASYLGNKIAWYENDGNENFTSHTITTDVDGGESVYAVDVDGDGDMDVLSASTFDDKIAWYENDGNENFTSHIITISADGASTVSAVDLDGDGDMDVLSASAWDDKIAWYENDGNEYFTSHTITISADGAYSVCAADVDGDGDMDVLSASMYDDKIAWYENDGSENFTSHTITTSTISARSVYAVDVDGDGDMDVLSASLYDDKIAWYENLLSPDTLHVPADYTTIQAAIDAAYDGNVVLVAEDTYYENINFNGKAITVASHFLVDGNETHIENTIIDGSQPIDPDFGSVVLFISGEDTNSVLCGFTITGGTGTYDPYPARFGGGIGFSNSGAQIKNNIIEFNTLDNTSLAYGGGIFTNYSNNSNIIIKNNIIQNNTCNGTDYACGGGIKITTNGYALISNNKILQNTVSAGIEATGGGIECWGPINEVYIVNNYIKGNTVQTNYNGGGGIDIYECTTNTPVLENNIIVGNYSNLYGGGVAVDLDLDERLKPGSIKTHNTTESDNLLAPVFFANNTIINNTAGVSGGGIYTHDMTSDIMNSILWGNTAPADSQISGIVNIVYSDVEGGYPGTNNIDLYPEFMDTTNGDYHLSDISPCIGAAIDSLEIGGTWYYCPPLCYYGSPRPNPSGSMPDIGACESPLADPINSVENDLLHIPDEYSLAQNYPNPFNPTTTIVYGLIERTNVELKLFDVLGREVETIVNREQDAGYYEVEFNASRLASGIYFYRIQAGSFVETKKMMLLK